MAEVKLVMTWDIQEEKERSYIEFAVNEFAPALGRMGLRITDAWYTQAGFGPHVTVAGLITDAEAAQGLLNSGDFRELQNQLLEFVENFQWYIRRPNSGIF